MRKIFAVTNGDWCQLWVYGVFSTRELAEAFVPTLIGKYDHPEDFPIEEWSLDAPTPEQADYITRQGKPHGFIEE